MPGGLATVVWLAWAKLAVAHEADLSRRWRNVLLGRLPDRIGMLFVPGRIVQVHPGQVAHIALTPGAGDRGEEVGRGASTPWEEQLKVNHRREMMPGLVWVLYHINMLKKLIMI